MDTFDRVIRPKAYVFMAPSRRIRCLDPLGNSFGILVHTDPLGYLLELISKNPLSLCPITPLYIGTVPTSSYS